MKIGVGTKNPAKVDAVKEIIAEYDILKAAEVVPVDVDSGISEQPMTLEETVQGAMNRAKSAHQGCDLGIGLESGLFKMPMSKSEYMDICVCAIFDGERFHLGTSSAFEYPKKLIDLILHEGIDISRAAKKLGLTDHPYVGHAQGMIGILTKGRLTRKEYTRQSLITALIHLENPELY
ncbi:MAG: inosine/xanthosine triphosphatase [Parcubacteria group bacterium]|nr:inosine/xanthosine triphosphatase [Parcubacteria group bacterium]